MYATVLTWLLAPGLLQGPIQVHEDVLRLARIRLKMSENLGQLPNYTCVQTIERSRRRARSRRFELTDTLRLEVALVNGKEMFSWPGAGRFEDRQLTEMVGGGTIGNGNFALHARSVFLGNAPVFVYQGAVEADGRRMHQYSYQVPLLHSGYRIRVGEQEAIVAYRGSFLVDAATYDLVRLEVIAYDIPPQLEISAASDVMGYARQRIGTGEFLLPRSSELTMIDLAGNESRNRTQFSSCRQYTGESYLSFAHLPSDEEQPAAPEPPRQIELPEGLTLDFRLESPVRYGVSAIGDQLSGTLGSDAKHRGRVILPKGALVKGRLTRLEKYFARTEHLLVGVELSEAAFGGGRAEVHAVLEQVGPSFLAGSRATVGSRESARPTEGKIFLTGNPLELRKGFRMLWRIESTHPNGEKQ